MKDRLRRFLPGVWLGAIVATGGIAAPALFANLATTDAGRVARSIFASEAALSLGLGAIVVVLERRLAAERSMAGLGSQFSSGMGLALGAIFCTVLGNYALAPMIAAAHGQPGFVWLHGASSLLFVAKGLLVAGLAWGATRNR